MLNSRDRRSSLDRSREDLKGLARDVIMYPGALKMLKLLRNGRMYTRQALSSFAHWDRSIGILGFLASKGLIRRYPEGNKVYNEITKKGLRVLEILEDWGF